MRCDAVLIWGPRVVVVLDGGDYLGTSRDCELETRCDVLLLFHRSRGKSLAPLNPVSGSQVEEQCVNVKLLFVQGIKLNVKRKVRVAVVRVQSKSPRWTCQASPTSHAGSVQPRLYHHHEEYR